MKANQAAFEIGQLADHLARGYHAHTAAMLVATDPRAEALSPPILPGMQVPLGYAARKDGTEHAFHFKYYLRLAATDAELNREWPRIWLVGSLLTVGDALARHDYFDHAPELELVYHLRNGVAHGNRFNITRLKRLRDFPAHNRDAWIKGDLKTVFEITPKLNGQPILFDFFGPGDVLDILMSVGMYLIRMGNGDPLRP